MPALSTQATPTSPSLRRLMREIDRISALPDAAARVAQIAETSSEAADLKRLLESDPALCTRVLRYAKSPECPVRDRITNLPQMVSYLGTRKIRNLAMTAPVCDAFRGDETIGPYRRSQLWEHSVAVGVCARMLARRRRLPDPEAVFLAGLLHDVGIILEDQYRHDAFTEVIGSLHEAHSLAEREREVLGFDHMALGERVALRWEFPDVVVAAIRYHHMSVRYRGDHIDAVRCVEAANFLCTFRGIASVGLKRVRFSRPAFAGLELAQDDVPDLIEELDGELAAEARPAHG